MEYQQVVRDFAERTKANLDYVCKQKRCNPDLEIYEKTQLVNSMLGLLVFPQQRFVQSIPEKSRADLEREGWPIPEVVGDFEQVDDLRQLVS